jgi:hypothetical protein
MNTDTRLGTVDEILALFPTPVQQLARAARSLIETLDADSFEVPRLGEKGTTYGIGPSKMKEAYCYLVLQKDYLNLGFFHGTTLRDESGLLEGTGKLIRHIKIRTLDNLKNPEVRSLIVAAIADRRAAARN